MRVGDAAAGSTHRTRIFEAIIMAGKPEEAREASPPSGVYRKRLCWTEAVRRAVVNALYRRLEQRRVVFLWRTLTRRCWPDKSAKCARQLSAEAHKAILFAILVWAVLTISHFVCTFRLLRCRDQAGCNNTPYGRGNKLTGTVLLSFLTKSLMGWSSK